MYLGHFALREAPFSITPDTDFYFAHDGAQATLNTLLVALRSGEGFLKVVGELGCGKTVLCRQLLKTLHSECVTAYIPNPDMGPDDLLCALAAELGLDRVRLVAQRLGLKFNCPVITVAGTNGKGSTCAMLEAVAQQAVRIKDS